MKNPELVAAYGGSFLIPEGDSVIGRWLKQTGRFQTEDIGRVLAYLDGLGERPAARRLFIDIGANIGTHSVAALSEYGFERVLAVEPSAGNHRLLVANLALHGLLERASCIQAAASDAEGPERLFHNADNCGDHRLGNVPRAGGEGRSASSEEVRRLDALELLLQHTRHCDPRETLCWVDTQGHEPRILRSILPLVELGMPVLMEFWPYGMEAQGGSWQDLAALLRGKSLVLARLDHTGVRPLGGLRELGALWRELRAADDGTPEGARYTELLLHATPVRTEISAEEARRIDMTASCQDSRHIPKVEGAGRSFSGEAGDYQLMHNGLKVVRDGYHGRWMSELITRLEGHHEPQEELVFHEILQRAAGDGLMVELGCYWAYYSLWFLQGQPHRQAIGLEPDDTNLAVGRRNALLNGLEGRMRFLHGMSAAEGGAEMDIDLGWGRTARVRGYTVQDLLEYSGRPGIEILHCDTQGAERVVVDQAIELGRRGQLRFYVLSTHAYEITGDPLTHQTCLAKLRQAGGHIIAEHDVHESFSGDGLIVASFKELDRDLRVEVSHNRYATSLFPNPAEHLAQALAKIEELRKAPAPSPAATPAPAPARRGNVLRRLLAR